MTRKRRKLPSPAPSEVFEGRRLRPRTTSRLANGSQESRPHRAAQKTSHLRKRKIYHENDSCNNISDDSDGTETADSDNSQGDSRPRAPRRRRLRPAEKQVNKGKGRACPPDRAVDDDVTQGQLSLIVDEEAALLRADWPRVSGPFPSAAKHAAVQLGQRTRLEAARIARLYKKSPREVLLHAGLGVRISRQNNNPSNKFRTWYAAHHPKPRAMSLADFNREMSEAYRQFLESFDSQDEEARKEAFRPILDFCASQDAREDARDPTMRSAISRMRSATNQFTTLAGTYHNLEDIEVIGAVVYTGTHAGAKQLSTIFGGSATVQLLIEKNKVDVRTFLDKLATGIKSVNLCREGFNIPTLLDGNQNVDVDCRLSEAPRDRDRRVFTIMMQRNLEPFDGVVSKKIHWKEWLNTAWRHHLCIVDWPDEVPPPGPNFILKGLKAQHLKVLVQNYIENVKNPSSDLVYPTIVRWSDADILMDDNDVRKGRIALVRSRGNVNLRLLSDCKAWLQRSGRWVAAGSGRAGPAAALADDRSQSPFMSQHRSSTDTTGNIVQPISRSISRPAARFVHHRTIASSPAVDFRRLHSPSIGSGSIELYSDDDENVEWEELDWRLHRSYGPINSSDTRRRASYSLLDRQHNENLPRSSTSTTDQADDIDDSPTRLPLNVQVPLPRSRRRQQSWGAGQDDAVEIAEFFTPTGGIGSDAQ